MSKKSKGTYYERKARQILESQGFYVIRSAGSFGLFDLVAINPNNGKVKLIQVKSGKAKIDKQSLEQMKKFKKHFQIEIWNFKNKKLEII